MPTLYYMPKFQFPLNSRKFSASLASYGQNSLLWAGLTIFLLLNIYAKINLTPAFQKELLQTLQKPFSSLSHETLAYRFWQQGLITAAQRELGLANVLGASTEDEKIAWAAEPEKARAAYDYWKSVVAAKPDFRDAFVTLAATAYQLGNFDEARAWLIRAQTLDPNSPMAEDLDRLVK